MLEDNPYGLLRYEGDPQPTLYSLDGGEYVIYLGTFSKILSPGLRLGWTAAPRPVLEKMNLGKRRRRPVLVVADPALRASPTSPSATGARYLGTLTELYRRRRDTMLDALAEHFPRRGDVDAAARAGCSSGRRCPTTSTRPTCWRGRCARRTSRSCPGARRTSTAAAARRCG